MPATLIAMLKRFWHRLLGNSLSLEDRLIRLVSLTISFLLIITLISNYILGLPPIINVLVAVLIIIYSSTYFYTEYFPITSLVKWLFIGFGIALMFPLWFLNGGLLGSTTPYFFVIIFMGSIILNRNGQYKMLALLMACFFALVVLEWLFPEWVVAFETKTIHKWDMVVSMTSTILASSGLIITFRLSYLKDHDQLVSVSNDLNKSNNKLQVAKEVAEKASKTKSAFLAKMSHELRTPLNTIIGAGDLLQKTKLSSDQRELVQLMEESSESLLNLISDILDLSKVEADRLEVKNAPTDLEKLAENMSEFARYKIEATNKSIAFTSSFGSTLPSGIIGDHLRLKQVITNLLSNAVKYTESGCIEFIVDSSTDENNKEWLCFTVKDTGIGIPESQLESISQPFRQGSNTPTQSGSAGLGLAICQSLATLMGGYMSIESTLNEGSVFTFALPLRRYDLEAHQQKKANKPAQNMLNSVRILVAEDNKINQIIIQKLLQSLSITAELASNGAEALEKVKAQSYDIVLMDLHMPEMDGLQAAKAILTDGSILKKPKIIALTANALKEDEERCFQVGMHAFLSKPITSGRLEACLRKVMKETPLTALTP